MSTTLALYDLESMTEIQSVVMPNFIATCWTLSLDSKQLVVGDAMGRIRLVPTDDLSIQRDLIPSGGSSSRTTVLSVGVAVLSGSHLILLVDSLPLVAVMAMGRSYFELNRRRPNQRLSSLQSAQPCTA